MFLNNRGHWWFVRGGIGVFLTFLTGFGAIASAQSSPPSPPATVLVIGMERVLSESAIAQDIKTQIEEIRARTNQKMRDHHLQLKQEEEGLVGLRKTLEIVEFERQRREFEDKINRLRREDQVESRRLQTAFDLARTKLQQALMPILVTLMQERGASLMLDETQVILNAKVLDITEEAIKRLDASTARIQVILPKE